MPHKDSVRAWLERLKTGDQAAAQPLWERYFNGLVHLARSRMANRRATDEEDVALSAFDSFCRGASAGRFPRLDDGNDLWRILVVIVSRKVHDYAQHEQRLKRGGPGAAAVEVDWGTILGSGPTPDFALEMAEQCERLLDRLGDESLRAVALWKMEGFTAEEIAEKMKCAPRTVERKLRLIRELWCKLEQEEP